MSNSVTKYAIKIDNLNLFFSGGGWKAGVDDATKFDSVESAKSKAISLNKPGLVIVPVVVRQSPDNW